MKAQPAHIFLDREGVLFAFLLRVGVIEAQVAGALVILRQAEIQTDRLGMADMQIAIRFGRKPRGNHAMLAFAKVGFND